MGKGKSALPPKVKKALSLTGLFGGLLLVASAALMMSERRDNVKNDGTVRNVLLDRNTRDVSLDAVESSLKKLARENHDLARQVSALQEQLERQAYRSGLKIDPAALDARLNSMSRQLQSLQDQYKYLSSENSRRYAGRGEGNSFFETSPLSEGGKTEAAESGSGGSSLSSASRSSEPRASNPAESSRHGVSSDHVNSTLSGGPEKKDGGGKDEIDRLLFHDSNADGTGSGMYRTGRSDQNPDHVSASGQAGGTRMRPGSRITVYTASGRGGECYGENHEQRISDRSASADENSPGNEGLKSGLYLPAGSILSGVFLNGMDAPTGQGHGRDQFPALIRLKKEAVLPNRYRSDIRECFLIVSGYGDLSSERAYLRGELISCITADRKVIEGNLDAYVVGSDGFAGVRGRLVSKQGQIIAKSLMSGFLSGLSGAFDVKAVPTISTSTSGSVSYESLYSSKALQGAAASGISSSLGRIAD